VMSGTLTRPLPPPTGFGDAAGLAVLTGGGREGETPARSQGRRAREAIEREIADAERREATARERVEHLRRELESVQAEAADLRDRVRAAEADARGASMDVRRLRSRLR